jgi:hypothetical protein
LGLADRIAILYGAIYILWVFTHERGTPLNTTFTVSLPRAAADGPRPGRERS